MGCDSGDNGITLKFLDKNGHLDTSKPVIFGKAVALYSATRTDHPGDLDPVYGSQDWLTEVLVADDPVSLAGLPRGAVTVAYTSTSSKGVLLRWDTTDWEGSRLSGVEHDQVTIAMGYPSGEAGRFKVEELLVLPSGTLMDPNHPLWDAWKFASHTLQTHYSLAMKARKGAAG
jgi:hypothetical protein